MKHRMLGALFIALLAASPAGAETPRDLYTRALSQERVIRDAATKPTLAQMRHVVALYESLVRTHPTSGYCDNALWQGANVASLAYERFGEEADRKTAARLLNLLKTGYPSSKLASQASSTLASLGKKAGASDADPRPAPVAVPPPPPVIASAPAAMPAPTPPPSPTTTAAVVAPAKSRSDPSPAGVATLKDVTRTTLPDGVRLTVELDAEVSYHQEEIVNPRRLFFDLKNVRTVPSLQDASLKYEDDLVKEIRLGRHPQNTVRVVVDLEGVASYAVYPLYSPYRLVMDFRRTTAPATAMTSERSAPAKPMPFVAPPPIVAATAAVPALPLSTATKASPPPPPAAPVPAPSEPKAAVLRDRTESRGPATSDRNDSKAAATERVDTKAPLPSQPSPASLPPAAPSANSNGKFSLSRQLGLGVSRIVIDAGHGGHDPGAHGNGVNESELTLDVALRLQKLLDKSGVEVVMTRDTDVFIPLEERTAIANREGADLFLSIHANASRNIMARGVETYFLNFANNPEAEAVAARENATSGQPMHSLPDIVRAIALNNKINESRDLAETVQKSMIKRLTPKNRTIRDLGVKQAPFVVLIGAGMPSVLAEISFVTNKQDGTLLKTQGYRQQIAQALMDAVLNYQQSLKTMSGIGGKKATQ